MRAFIARSGEPELMDTEPCDFETFRDCLVDLAKVNTLTLAYGPTLRFLRRLKRAGALDLGRPVRIVDVGSGYGDMLRRIGVWAERNGVAVDLVGVDLNPWAARAASKAAVASSLRRWTPRWTLAFCSA